MIIWLKMWPLERTQGFSTIWPSDRHDQLSNSSEILSSQTFLPSFMIIRLKLWPLECTQGFSKIWHSDLVLDLTWSIFKLVRDFIKSNILTKFHESWIENVASRAYTRFFSDFTWWPSFWRDITHFRTRSIFHQTNILIKLHESQTENVAFRAYTRFS